MWIYIKKISIGSGQFFLTFFALLYINCLIVKPVWTLINLKKISIGTVMRNPEMLKFVPDHIKTKTICRHAVKDYLTY